MDSLKIVLWLLWAFACALALRLAFTRLLRPWLGELAQLGAYAMWPTCFAAGACVVQLTGMEMYGFDPNSPQFIGYLVFFFSPLGLPTLVGAPAVLAIDLARARIHLGRIARRRRTA
ncbi:MAG: hypothetical protein QM608_17485 [Caulobacter sp.]